MYMTKVTLSVNFWSKLYSKSFTSDCVIERGVQIGAPFKVPSYLAHSLVVPSIRFQCICTPSLCSVAGGCSLTSFSCWGCLSLRFVAGDAPSLRSVAGGAPRFAWSLSIKLFHRIANLVVSMHMTIVWELR